MSGVYDRGVRIASRERFEPDLFVVPAIGGRLPSADSGLTTLVLVCEVPSSSAPRYDRITKRRVFQSSGVPAYWIIDGDAEVFEIWHPGGERPAIIDDRVGWMPERAVALELDVAEFFAGVADGAELP